MTDSSTQPLGRRTLGGLVWAYGSYAGGRVLVFVTTAILARLLAPSEFGLVALAITFIALLETLSDLGVSQALVIVKEEDGDEKAETVFAISVLTGLGLALLIAAMGPPAALFFDEPALTAVLPALGLNLLVRSVGTTHYALAQKRIEFRSRTGAELADVIVRGVTGITLAIVGLGAWSLVLGYLAGSLAFVASLFMLVPWRPRLRPRRRHVRELITFGGTLTAVNVLAALVANFDYLAIGRALGTTALGLYSLAFRLPELLVLNLSVVAGRVLFPAFATLDREALGRAFLTSLRYSLVVSLPLAALLALLADPVILVAFGDQWTGAADPMRLLAVYACAVAVGIPAGSAYKATGRVNVLLKLAIPRTIVVVAAMLVFVDEGIVAIAICQAAAACVFDGIGILLASRLLGVGLRPILTVSWPPFAATLALALPVLAVEAAIDAPLPELAAAGVAGGAAYLVVLRVFLPDVFSRLRAIASPASPPPAEPPAGEARAAETPLA